MGNAPAPGNESDKSNGRTNPVETPKKHPLRVFGKGVVAFAAGVVALAALVTLAGSAIIKTIDPYRDSKEEIRFLGIDLDVEAVNGKLGTPEESHALCKVTSVCHAVKDDGLLLNVYRDDHYTVRAVFDEGTMEFYAVTLGNPEIGKFRSSMFKPHVRWLDRDLGILGERTYVKIHEKAAVDVKPATRIFLGSRESAYAEVLLAGGAGDGQGLILGWAPDGYAKLPWNLEGANALYDAQPATGEGSAPFEAADNFRVASVPNTYGVFHEDGGHTGSILRDPGNVIELLLFGNRF